MKATPKGTSTSTPKSAKAAYGAEKKAASGKNTSTQSKASSSSDAKNAQNNTPINELFETFLKKGFKTENQNAEDGIFRTAQQKDSTKDGKEKPRRGEDVIVQTAISPVEAEQGVVKTVNVQHNELCRRCSGTGKVNGTPCTGCNGEKILVRLKKIDVRIPAGVKQGSRVRVDREGGRGQGGAENGDLFLQIEIAYDPSLRIEGLDVYGEMPISVTDAVLGGEIEVPTLMGPVKMSVPPSTASGKTFRLKERGAQNGQNIGDHYVTVKIVPPVNLSAREKELYEELARLRPEKPMPKKSR
jgi:DnaJ-class molecular chaperone